MLLVGIEPKSPGIHIFSRVYIPRLGLPQLLTIAQNMGHECEIYAEELGEIDWNRIAAADIILISTITSTAPRAYKLIKAIRSRYNNSAPIIMGGPHVTFLPEEALDEGADYVFRNEADDSFVQFLNWFESSRDAKKLLEIDGLSMKVGDTFRHNNSTSLVDLDKLPTPNLELIQGFKKPGTIPLITSRGCPWNCDFCSEVSMFGKRYRFRSEEKVIEDIRYYFNRYGRTSIFIAEDNFGANRPRLENLCRSIMENKLVCSLEGQVRLDLAKHPETLKLMNRAGFQRAYIGYESINPASLKAVGKGYAADNMAELTRRFHKNGIAVHAMWVLGFDDDDLETVKKTVKAAITWRIETTQFLILVPIPGSRLYERFKSEDRIFNWDWAKYDGHHVNFIPKSMSVRELQVAVALQAMLKFYKLRHTTRIFIYDLTRTFRRAFRFKIRRSLKDLENNLVTLFARIWGNIAARKSRKSIKQYLEKLAAVYQSKM
jgi:radical SAM superfamily enzyme YgiQ (UPF0313 family)